MGSAILLGKYPLGSFTTESAGEETRLQTLMPFVTALFTMKAYGCRKGYGKCCQPSASLLHCVLVHILVVPPAPVSSETVIPTATSASHTLRPTALAETAGEQNVILMQSYTIDYMSIDKRSLLTLCIII